MEKEKIIAEAIVRSFVGYNPMGDEKNVADGLLYIGNQLSEIAKALNRLGLSDAFTDKGAIEVLAEEVKNLGDKLAK